jgi:TonB family protein
MHGPETRKPTAGVLAAGALLAAFAATTTASDATAAASTREEVAVLRTPHGEIVWRFFPKEAPGHTAYVKELIRKGFYDGTKFHRVIPHFVIQGGDPLSKDDDRTNDGSGEADRTLKAEFSELLNYRPGTVGMARDSNPDSGSCQFFIALENIPRLSRNYSIFGEVIEGLDVARKIAGLPRDLDDNPLEAVVISAVLEKREVPEEILSLSAGESGERITGPARRPVFYDPGDRLWSAPPVLVEGGTAGGPRARGRMELTVDLDGSVIDARFPVLHTQGASVLREEGLKWRFAPLLYDGESQLVRFEIDSDGSDPGPTSGGGAPLDAPSAAPAPVAAVRVDLEKGREAPGKSTKLRLTIDGRGEVTKAAVQESCGDTALDEAAREAALKMLFAPVVTGTSSDGSPATQAVYLNVEARFVEAPVD